MKIVIENSYSQLYGFNSALVEKLKKFTSYCVEGHQFVPSFRDGVWDGYVRLLRMTPNGSLSFPTGLLSDVLKVIENNGIRPLKIQDRRRKTDKKKKLYWLDDDIKLRDYQREAVDLVTNATGPTAGRGILKLPIRSGKTVVAAALIRRLGLRSLFVATSQLILSQTSRLFSRIFGTGVGVVGDGEFSPDFVTIGSIQRLQRLDNKTKKLLELIDVLIVDEVHHMRGDSWREPIMKANARYKIGLSATVTVNRKLCERSAIWLKSATGPIIMDVPMKRLVDDGHIVAPDILLTKINNNGAWDRSSWSSAYEQLIIRNDKRNRLIAESAGVLAKSGHRVLIDTGRLNHIKRLYTETKNVGIDVGIIHGGLPATKRSEVLSDFVSGRKPVIIGTVMGEGVDVPILSAVINAEGGKDSGATVQRMRNLTKHPDKTKAIMIDFIDDGNNYLSDHSHRRLTQYNKEPVFNVIGPVIAEESIKELEAIISR